MKLMTEVELPRPTFTLDYREQGLVIGSCFAEHIGQHLGQSMLRVATNPYGVLYNPASMARALSCTGTHSEELVHHNQLWHSMLHHGSFSRPTPDETLAAVNEYVHTSVADRYDYAIVTLGTAWIYRMDGSVVANCHKIPAQRFIRQRLTLNETVEALEQIMALCPRAKFIFTVSPIRHLKDGLSENAVSKATLRLAIEEIVSRNAGRAAYFPAYEIMLDQLRDYRFYDRDMTHPSDVAVEYITDAFCRTFFDTRTQDLIARAAQIRRARAHRPMHPQGEEYLKFMEYVNRQVSSLMQDFPDLGTNIRL